MEIRFRDHASFHRAAVGMTVGAALLGLVAWLTSPPALRDLAPLLGGAMGIGIGAAIAYGWRPWRVIAALAAVALLSIATPTWQTLLAGSVVVGVAIAIGERGIRAMASMFVAAAVVMLAMWAALRVSHAQRTELWPLWAKDVAAATAMGIVAVLALLPRHLGLASDPVAAAIRALPVGLDAEVRSLCGRSVAIWQATRDKLGDDDAGVALVRDGVLKALEVAAKSASIGAQPGTSDAELAKRMDDLDARIAAATDDEIKDQYRSARAALSDQRHYRDGIRQNRERLVARLHNHVAALEKFEVAAGGLAAARVVKAGNGAATAEAGTEELAELSHGVAASGEALAEVELA